MWSSPSAASARCSLTMPTVLSLSTRNRTSSPLAAPLRITPTAEDTGLWDAMDQASDEVAKVFVSNLTATDEFSVFTPEGEKRVTKTANLKDILPYTPNDKDAATALGVKRGRRDGLGTTHHETGSLRMGTDPTTSVTNADARFHGVDNAYVVG